jgi:glycosyltransferase involved in cell wall biosynthesis
VKNPFEKFHLATRSIHKITGKKFLSLNDQLYQFQDFDRNKVDLLHFYNAINCGHTPWITTFETLIPRLDSTISIHHGQNPNFSQLPQKKQVRRALDAIASSSCKRIIAMSQCNANMQKFLLKAFPEHQECIENKLIVMHPPQAPLVSSYAEKNINLTERIKFILVGASFFRKGGMEILETFKKLKEYHTEFELVIVSSLRVDDYATKETIDDIQRARNFIEQNLNWITYHSQLPNKDVLNLMKQCHVGLLPTYADTYGFSVLELQAAGCPVITTNIRALPEVNDDSKGWVIEVPKNYLGEAIYTTPEERMQVSDAIKQGLEQVLHQIFSNRECILHKANQSIRAVIEKHSVSDFADRMREVYQQALQ